MHTMLSRLVVIAGISLITTGPAWADVPAPPVNQTIGMRDVAIGNLSEALCRTCHSSGVPNRHHMLFGQPTRLGSLEPYPDADGDGVPDTVYGCLNCHGPNFTVMRDCTVCHNAGNPHHATATATGGNCKACHGSVVDNMNDGHYIPTYSPSLITPKPNEGDGLPFNSRCNGAGACNYCHDAAPLASPPILTNAALHHGTGLTNCAWCHDILGNAMRRCEGCHGPNSLHNIQADSPRLPTGTIVVGGEDAGYGHVGRDAGPGDSDCWGCHGFPMARTSGNPGGPIIPTVYSSDLATMTAETDTTVVLRGSAFRNIADSTQYDSSVAVASDNGAPPMILTPRLIQEDMLAVTIPGSTPPGNYNIQATKADFTSNPAVVTIIPKVAITRATSATGVVRILGRGFSGYALGSGTLVRGTRGAITAEATITSWTDTAIVAEFSPTFRPQTVTVNSIFGSATASVIAPIPIGGGSPVGSPVGSE